MKTLLRTLLFLLLAFSIAWIAKKPLFLSYLRKELHTKVTLDSLSWSLKEGFTLKNLVIYNPPGSKTEKALLVKNFSLVIPISALWKKQIDIPFLHLQDIFLGIEFFDHKQDLSNWSYLFQLDKKESSGSRSLLIEHLLLEDLQVQMTLVNGKQKTFPPVSQISLQNISSENFPVSEIESAILKEVLKSIFYQIGIQPLIKTLNPIQWLPGVIPFFPKKSSAKKTEEKTS